MLFIETPLFTKQITELLDDDSYAEFQRVLAEIRKPVTSSEIPAGFEKSE